jgi:hypothetical protein
MAKAATYIKDIRAQVRADHGGKVPDHLNLTIRNYAQALELRDKYRETILDDGVTRIEVGSTGQMVTRQHPLCGLLYQQEMLCLSYAKALGGTAAKAAAKPEDQASKQATDSLDEFIDGMKGK